MLRLLVVLFLALCLAAHADDSLYEEVQGNGVFEVSLAESKADTLARTWQSKGSRQMAYDTNRALGAILKIAARNLRYRGFGDDAKYLEEGWKRLDGEVIRLNEARLTRRITDYAPLSSYLAVAYFILEEKLGYEICRALHLDLIQSFNYTLRFIFVEPCVNGEKEFFYHFVADDDAVFHPYKGLAPATSYLLTAIGCNVATFGAGIFWLCGPLSMGVEYVMTHAIGPAVSPKLFNAICSKGL